MLAHELSHHLGSHTVALTIGHWLSMPVFVLARIGFFLQNVATAATRTFARKSSSLTVVGQFASTLLMGISWVFLSGLLLTNAIANVVGRNAELQADRRAVTMGFGRPLASALRRVIGERSRRAPDHTARAPGSHAPASTNPGRPDRGPPAISTQQLAFGM